MSGLVPDLATFLELEYKEVVVPDICGTAPCYLASHPELPGCLSQGETPEEAVANVRHARELYLRSLLEDGLEVPLPAGLASVPAGMRQP